jgi:AI-2 transport protein TqsA
MQTEQSRSQIQTVCLMVLAGSAIAYAVFLLRPVLMPFVVAVFVVSGIGPILDSLERRLGVDRLMAAAITFLAGIFLMLLLSWALWSSTAELAANAPAYRNRIREIVHYVEEHVPGLFVKEEAAETAVALTPTGPQKVDGFLDTLVRDGISDLSSTLLSLITTSIVVLIFVFFLLLGGRASQESNPTWHEIDRQMRNYLVLKTVISMFTGLAFGVALKLFGIPMAMTFGVLAFLLNFIPNVGPLIASVLPIPLIVLDPAASVWWMLSAVGVTSGVQFLSGNVVEPKLMSDSSDLHPIVVLLALMFWGVMWGIVGMFLATPITASLRIVFDRIEATRPIAQLLAGKWPNWSELEPDQPSMADAV